MIIRLQCAILAIAIAAGGCAFGQSAAAGGNKKPAFTMVISAVQNSVKPGSDVRIKVDIKNTSTQQIRLFRSKYDDGRPYKIEVSDEEGGAARLTKFGRKVLKNEGYGTIDFGGGGHIALAPGATLGDDLLISDLFDLTVPGKYTVQLQRLDEAGTAVKSNTITITVTE